MKTFDQLTETQKLNALDHFTAVILGDILAGELKFTDESINDEAFGLWMSHDYKTLVEKLIHVNPEVCGKLESFVAEAANSALYLDYGEHSVHLRDL